jgi:radical SAM superfamily enzyme YgiQ (UPF0313 family)
MDEEMLIWMKKAGCYLVAFGFEVGSDESKKKIRKYTTAEQDMAAAALCKKHGIKTYGFFMIGFPWEAEKDVKETIDHMFRLDSDFVEISFPTPYPGTELYNLASREGLLPDDKDIITSKYFSNPIMSTRHVPAERLKELRKRALLRYYLRPKYIFRTLAGINTLNELRNYGRYGVNMIINSLASSKH